MLNTSTRRAREGEVATAGASMVYYHRWLTVCDGADWRYSPTLKLMRLQPGRLRVDLGVDYVATGAAGRIGRGIRSA